MMNGDKVKMGHFSKWVEDKNAVLALFALIVATSADDCFEVFEEVRGGKRIGGNIRLPKLKNWLALYRRREKVVRGVLSALKKSDDRLAEIIEFYEAALKGFKVIRKMKPAEIKKLWEEIKEKHPEETLEFIKSVFEVVKGHQDLVIEDIVSDGVTELSGKLRRSKRPLTKKAELIFFVRVLFPCFISYATYPDDLLREAQCGNVDALGKLIALDRSVMFDMKVSELVHQEQAEEEQPYMASIVRAIRSPQRVEEKSKEEEEKRKRELRKSIKYSLGGLISLMSIAIKKKITAKEIYALFDAVARDKNQKDDPDLKDIDVNSFAREIHRHRIFWHNVIPLSDK